MAARGRKRAPLSAAGHLRAVLAAAVVALFSVLLAGSAFARSSHPTIRLRITAATPSSVSLAWSAAHSRARIVRYVVVANGSTLRPAVPASRARRAFTVRHLKCAQTVSLKVVAVDARSTRTSSPTTTVSSSPCVDSQKPTAPSRFRQAAASQTSVVETWRASSDNVGVVGYEVYRGVTLLQTVSRPSATVQGLLCGSDYEFSADAVDAAGNRSALRSWWVRTADCVDVQAPTPPTAVGVSASSTSSVSLAWTRSRDDVGVAGYRVAVGGGSATTSPTRP